MVVLNDERVERFGASHVPTTIWQLLGEQPVDDTPDVLAEIGAHSRDLPVDARLSLAFKEAVAVAFLRATALPAHPVADEVHGPAGFVARRVETELAQQHKGVHRRVPAVVPCRAAPTTIITLERKQALPQALSGDAGALGSDFRRSRTGQIPHHLPADRSVRIEQPIDDSHRSCGDRVDSLVAIILLRLRIVGTVRSAEVSVSLSRIPTAKNKFHHL
jgi:hypothetical protein